MLQMKLIFPHPDTDEQAPLTVNRRHGDLQFRCMCGQKCRSAMELIGHTQAYRCQEIMVGSYAGL